MPELPEVHHTVLRLQKALAGRTITRVSVKWHRTVAYPDAADFKAGLKGKQILSLRRRGKYVVFVLGDAGKKRRTHRANFLVAHMRMSGSFRVITAAERAGKYARLILHLDDGGQVCFKDVRKFGRFWLVDSAEQAFGEIGPEPLDEKFKALDFIRLLKHKTGMIKPVLLNQKIIAGIGNIYADESLWRAGIHPNKRAAALSKTQLRALFLAVVRTLKQAIRDQGTDIGDDVVCGDYQPRVYGRKGKPCKRCRDSIQRLVVAQRGTYICPTCQKRAKA